MSNNARNRWVAAVVVAFVCGLLLRGCTWHTPGTSDVTVTVTVTSTSPPSASPSPSASSEGGGTDRPTPNPTSDAGSGVGSGTGHGANGTDLFSIAGNVGPVLEPGTTAPIDLTLTNPNDQPIRVTSLSVAIATITAPRATPTLPCTFADFVVGQPLGATSLIVPAHSSRTLTALGLTSAQLPSLGMLNTVENQDGCKGATVGLSYGGTAVWGDE
jgi:hypothetical protein